MSVFFSVTDVDNQLFNFQLMLVTVNATFSVTVSVNLPENHIGLTWPVYSVNSKMHKSYNNFLQYVILLCNHFDRLESLLTSFIIQTTVNVASDFVTPGDFDVMVADVFVSRPDRRTELLPSNWQAYDNVGDLGYILFGYRQSRIFRHIKYTALVTVCRMHERTRHGWYATE